MKVILSFWPILSREIRHISGWQEEGYFAKNSFGDEFYLLFTVWYAILDEKHRQQVHVFGYWNHCITFGNLFCVGGTGPQSVGDFDKSGSGKNGIFW